MSYTPPPSQIYWLKADTGAWQYDGSLIPCTNNTAVRQWDNQSSSGFANIEQSSTGNQPTYFASTINGLPGVQFVKANSQYMLTSSSIAHGIGTGNFTVAVVCKTLPTFSQEYITLFAIDTYNPACYLSTLAAASPRLYLGSGLTFTDKTIVADTAYLVVYGRTGTSTYDIHLWIAEIGSTLSVSTATTTSSTSIATGQFYVGDDGDNTLADVVICELMVFSNSLTTQYQNELVAYVNEKYAGTTVTGSSAATMIDF